MADQDTAWSKFQGSDVTFVEGSPVQPMSIGAIFIIIVVVVVEFLVAQGAEMLDHMRWY